MDACEVITTVISTVTTTIILILITIIITITTFTTARTTIIIITTVFKDAFRYLVTLTEHDHTYKSKECGKKQLILKPLKVTKFPLKICLQML